MPRDVRATSLDELTTVAGVVVAVAKAMYVGCARDSRDHGRDDGFPGRACRYTALPRPAASPHASPDDDVASGSAPLGSR